jgi:hypothetical protein
VELPQYQDPPKKPSDSNQELRGAIAAGGRPLLDYRTQLVDRKRLPRQRWGWRFTNWPSCSEASLVWVQPAGSRRLAPLVDSGSSVESGASLRIDDYPILSELVKSDEVEDLNWKIANGRARARSRRFFVSNRLRYMWVLTFVQGQFDRVTVIAMVTDFARKLRSALGVTSFPYWYSPEVHPGKDGPSHGWHVNFFVPMRIDHDLLEFVWSHGWVWVTDFEKSPFGPKGEPLGLCRTPREGWRRAATYGCKYAQKDWLPGLIGPRNHRYEIAQGYSPKPERDWVRSPEEAWEIVRDLVPNGETGTLQRWSSNDELDWERPPIETYRW